MEVHFVDNIGYPDHTGTSDPEKSEWWNVGRGQPEYDPSKMGDTRIDDAHDMKFDCINRLYRLKVIAV